MGCRPGIRLPIQCAISAWLSVGTGGFRLVPEPGVLLDFMGRVSERCLWLTTGRTKEKGTATLSGSRELSRRSAGDAASSGSPARSTSAGRTPAHGAPLSVSDPAASRPRWKGELRQRSSICEPVWAVQDLDRALAYASSSSGTQDCVDASHVPAKSARRGGNVSTGRGHGVETASIGR